MKGKRNRGSVHRAVSVERFEPPMSCDELRLFQRKFAPQYYFIGYHAINTRPLLDDSLQRWNNSRHYRPCGGSVSLKIIRLGHEIE